MNRTSPTLAEALAAEPFTLALGSGFFGFFAHLGMVQALAARDLKPRRLVGVSAGAIISAAWASGTPLSKVEETLLSLRRQDFWDPSLGLGLLRGRRFRRLLEETLSAPDFEGLEVPLAVTTVRPFTEGMTVIDSGDLPSAVHASCAVPFLFQPVRREGLLLWDGGVRERSGAAALAPDERTLFHHLASRSPWRRKGSRSMDVPTGENRCALVIEGLPRLGPFRLEEGPEAISRARAATERALDRPFEPIVQV
ncbi:MAG: patatin-like phospholipase family protein [Deltaproteobacteria bacterium]|nr:patatin-like phospholipase family protein [Deltaproteobacteria bacterium]